jgi:hypothetical protein
MIANRRNARRGTRVVSPPTTPGRADGSQGRGVAGPGFFADNRGKQSRWADRFDPGSDVVQGTSRCNEWRG